MSLFFFDAELRDDEEDTLITTEEWRSGHLCHGIKIVSEK